MNLKHSGFLWLLFPALVGYLGFASPAAAQQAKSDTAEECNLSADELEIYSATIDELLFQGPDPAARAILRERTSIGYPPGMASMKNTKTGEKELLGSVRMDTRIDFDARNKLPCTLEPHIEPVKRVQLVGAGDEFLSFPRGSGSWKAFYRKYPGATGFTVLSRIGFNPAKDQALVYLGNSCELLCGHGYLALLKKHKGKWSVVKSAKIWIAAEDS